MVADPVEDFPGQVKSGPIPFQIFDYPKALFVVIKAPAIVLENVVENIFAGVAERSMSQVVSQGDRFGQVLVEAKGAGNGPGNLGDFQSVGQPGPEMVFDRRNKNLGLVF